MSPPPKSAQTINALLLISCALSQFIEKSLVMLYSILDVKLSRISEKNRSKICHKVKLGVL
jgi:hypothetical protein